MFGRKKTFKKEFKEVFKESKDLFSFKWFKYTIISLIVFLVAGSLLFYINFPVPDKNIEYGLNFSHLYAEEMGLDWRESYIKILDELQPSSIRLVAYWDRIETKNDEYDYSYLKWQVEEAQKRNVNVILAAGKKVPRWPECFEPAWWGDLPSDAAREIELLDFIKTTVNEFKGYDNIKIWQIENEPFFPFGFCSQFKATTLKKETDLVKSMDARPILIQDSGEGGLWFRNYMYGDYLGISMYRKIWYDFWGAFLGEFIYFTYPLPSWSYKMKALLLGIPYQNIYVTELQGEPWGPGLNSKLSQEDKDHTMSVNDFINTISYAQRSGFKHIYFWGAEWWLWEKEKNNNPFYWDSAKALLRSSSR
jgi:hypothetical protein